MGGDVVVGSAVGGLQVSPVTHKAEHHADAASVIDTIATNGVHQAEGLHAAHFKSTARAECHVAVQHRVFSRVSAGCCRGPDITHQFCCHHICGALSGLVLRAAVRCDYLFICHRVLVVGLVR